MPDSLLSLLRPVHRRQRWQRVLADASLGLFLGAAAGCLLGLACWSAPNAVLRDAGIALLALGPLAGALLGWWAAADYRSAARAVDRAYGLKDCTVSALDFAGRTAVTPYHELTGKDAVRHLEGVRAGTAAPLRLPRSSPWAAAALALALVVLLHRGETPAPAAPLPAPPEAVLREAALIEGYAREIDKMGEEERLPELKKLAAEMKKQAEKMRQPGADVREALARISEMQMALSQVKAELNAPLVDGQLKELGSALREAPPLEQAGKALQESQLDRAARLLEAMARGEATPPGKEKSGRPGPKDERANRSAGEKAERVAREMAEKKLNKLGKATDKLAAGLKGDDEKMKEGAKDLADEVRQQERRKRINELLAREDRRLQDCKSRCEKQNVIPPRSGSQGSGNKPSPRPSPGAGQPQEKEKGQPRDGRGAQRERGAGGPKDDGKSSGKPGDGRQDRPGTEGPGTSDAEPGEARGDGGASPSRRLSPEAYRKFRRMSEATIEDEAIPLGLRESIRKYFELLRPPAVEDDAPAPAERTPARSASKG
jgi:hypothetical protein